MSLSFGELLKKEMSKVGFTERTVEDQARLSRSVVSVLAADKRPPSKREFKKLLMALPGLRHHQGEVKFSEVQILAPKQAESIFTTNPILAKPEAVSPNEAKPHSAKVQPPAGPGGIGGPERSPKRAAPTVQVETKKEYSITPKEPKAQVVTVERGSSPASPLTVKTKTGEQFTAVETIDPALAKCLLEGNVRNRSISGALVDSIARDIVAGKWILTHQGVALDKDGRLLDGQHRMLAIIKANMSVQMPVTYNVDPEAFNTIDLNNRPRRVADVFGLSHNTKNNTSVVAALKIIDALDGSVIKSRYTFSELDKLFEKYGNEVQFAVSSMKPYESIRLAGVFAGVAYAYPCDPKVIGEFVKVLTSRLNMTSPMVALYKACERMSPCISQQDRVDLALITMRCIMAAEKGEELKRVFRRGTGPNTEAEKSDTETYRSYRHFRARREKLGIQV